MDITAFPVTATFAAHKARRPPSISPGIDFATPRDTELSSPVTGTVTRWLWSPTGGRMLVIQDAHNRQWWLMHLQAALAAVGETVQAGQAVAVSGNSGSHTTGPHCHLSVRAGGRWVDPGPLLLPG